MNRLLRRLLQPPDPLVRFGPLVVAADAANARRDWAEAERLYAQALTIDPRRDDLWVQYGHALKERGRPAEAERCYAAAAEVAPTAVDALAHLGHLRKEEGRAEAALEAFGHALAADPRRADLRAEVEALGGRPPATDRPPRFLDVDDLPVRSLEQLPQVAAPPGPAGAGDRPRRSERGPILFLHLHKTGGLTLDDVLGARTPPRRICPVKDDRLHVYTRAGLDAFDLVSAHVDVGAARLLRRPARLISLFRAPRARLASFWRFHAGHPLDGDHAGNLFVRLAHALGPEAFFEDDRIRRAPEVFNQYLVAFSLTYAQVRAAPAVTVDQVPDHALRKALERIRGLDAVGLLERYDDSVMLACRALGLRPPRRFRWRNRTDVIARRMVGRPPPPVVMTPRLESAMADLVRFDDILYAEAKATFERRWRAHAEGPPPALRFTGP